MPCKQTDSEDKDLSGDEAADQKLAPVGQR